MRLELFKKYKNFSQGTIFLDTWIEWNKIPVSLEKSRRFNFRIIIFNYSLIDFSFTYKPAE